MSMEECDKFVENFLAEIPYLGKEIDNYTNDYLIEMIKTADKGVHELFFSSTPGNEKEMQGFCNVSKLSVLCVANILSVCNNASIAGKFKSSCDQQINRWLELHGSETGQEIFKNFLDSKLQISVCTQTCKKALLERLTKPPLREVMQIFAQTKTPIPAQLVVSAMKAIDSWYGELLIQSWLSDTPKWGKDFEWWDSFRQMQVYPWFHGVGANFFCDAIEAEVKNVLHDNVEGIQNWISSVNGPGGFSVMNGNKVDFPVRKIDIAGFCR